VGIAVSGTHLKFLSPQARLLRSGLGIDELVADAGAELFGVPAVCEAEHNHGVVAAEQKRARELERFAEKAGS